MEKQNPLQRFGRFVIKIVTTYDMLQFNYEIELNHNSYNFPLRDTNLSNATY